MNKREVITLARTSVQNDKGYCRKCEKILALTSFYETTNPFLDANGKLSICKHCCNDIYRHYLSIYSSIEDAMKLTCEDLDVRFSEDALRQTQSHVDKLTSTGKSADAVFGYYKSKLSSLSGKNQGIEYFRFKDSNDLTQRLRADVVVVDEDVDEDSTIFWGPGFTSEDVLFLDIELDNWKKTHRCDNRAELTLLKEICIKILTIRNKRAREESVSSDLKELQDLMKTASVDPAKANIASAGKSQEAFGIWIKDIETYRPAEWYDKQEKYKDMDGFIPYINNYIVRPIANFLTGSRNLKVDDNIDADLDSVDVDMVGDDNG